MISCCSNFCAKFVCRPAMSLRRLVILLAHFLSDYVNQYSFNAQTFLLTIFHKVGEIKRIFMDNVVLYKKYFYIYFYIVGHYIKVDKTSWT